MNNSRTPAPSIAHLDRENDSSTVVLAYFDVTSTSQMHDHRAIWIITCTAHVFFVSETSFRELKC